MKKNIVMGVLALLGLSSSLNAFTVKNEGDKPISYLLMLVKKEGGQFPLGISGFRDHSKHDLLPGHEDVNVSNSKTFLEKIKILQSHIKGNNMEVVIDALSRENGVDMAECKDLIKIQKDTKEEEINNIYKGTFIFKNKSCEFKK